jgi:stage II sporulation protein D
MILAAALVTVRLFWVHPPATARINGQEYRADHAASAQIQGRLLVEAPGSPKLALDGPLDLASRDGRLQLTLHMPMEEYVAGVLAGESSIFKSEEALKAMAVTARTYAVRHMGRHKGEGFDFCDTTHCQDLRLAARSERLRAAVEATEGELLWYQGPPADTYYHRHCGGTTEAAQYVWPDLHAPYLKQQSDTFCVATGRAEWRWEVRKQDLGGDVTILGRTPSGRVAAVRFAGRRMSATDFQLAVGRALGWDTIRSNFWDVVDRRDRLLFQGYGAGHGVGLCQAGAEERGEHGHAYRQILAFYFPGTTPGVGAQGFEWARMDGERVEVWSTRSHEDRDVVTAGDRALREAESRSGISIGVRVRLRIYPTVAAFRDATGEPGWVAASTSGRTIRMQPAGPLRAAGRLETTLRHEMLHVAIEGQASPRVPQWFREGLVLYLAGTATEPGAGARGAEQAMRREYESAKARVRALVERYGQAAVIGWLGRPASPAWP